MDIDRKRGESRLLYQACKKWIVVFLAAMLGLTVVSRFLDTIIVPQVTVDHPERGVLQYQVKGTAVLEAAELLSVPVLADISIRSVIAGAGQTVSGETPLFAYQLDELERLCVRQERELEQQKIALESELLSAQPLPKMSAEELALQEVARAEGKLARAREKLGKAEQEYQEQMEVLTKEYEEDLKKNFEDLVKEREKAYEAAEQEYELACLNKRLETQTASMEYDEAVNHLDDLEDEGASDAELRTARSEVEKAGQNKEAVVQKWQFQVEKAEQEMEDAYDYWQALYDDEEDVGRTLQKEFEQKLKAEKAELETAQEQLTDSSDAYQEALTALDNARKNDSYDQQGIERELELSELKRRSMELDIEAGEQELEKLKSLIAQNGVVYAPYSGLLTKIEFHDDSGLVQIGSGGILFKAEIDSDQAGSLNMDSTLSLTKDGRNLDIPATLRSLETDQEKDLVRLTADLGKTDLLPGTGIGFVCETKSPVYNLTIPVDALRRDNQGSYVLLVQERNTILGKELIAVRINVTVLAKTREKAAIEGGVTAEDRIVAGSSKQIEDGSRIRVVSE